MVLAGKLEFEIETKAPANEIHDLFGSRLHHVPHTTSGHIQGCEIHDGQFGKVVSVICWKYVHDGVAEVAKVIVEAIDDANFSTTFKWIEGDLLKEYKNFKNTVKATPKGNGSLVRRILEYEKLNKEIPDPCSFLQFGLHVTRDVDAHFTKT